MKSLLLSACLMLLSATDVIAQTTAAVPAPPSFGEVFMRMVPMFVIVFIIFWLLVLGPQKAKINQHNQLMSNLKGGELVVTTGGIIGKVVKVEKDSVLLELSGNARMKVEEAHILKLYQEPSSESKSNQGGK